MNVPNPVPFPSSSERVRVRSHGRIHFGLLEISESEPNCYGGIGLMVESASAVLEATICHSGRTRCVVEADTYWQPRIEAVSNQWVDMHGVLNVDTIRVIESPLPHQGMGSGTQMACSVAALLSAADHLRTQVEAPWITNVSRLFSIESLSKQSQRGKRSNIGLCGFLEGGFVLDKGRQRANCSDEVSRLRTERFKFPDWPVLVLQDTESRGDSGYAEASMFQRCSLVPNPNRELMTETIEQEILPAIESKDWDQFDIALGRYGRWAGKIFEPVQGGVYRSPQIERCVDIAVKLGLRGATQSSWGPTVCAFAKDAEHAKWCQSRLQAELPQLKVSTTRGANGPAQVEWL
jgi:beta-ribofuranosylaminobenzene 5'-phosphate synthase